MPEIRKNTVFLNDYERKGWENAQLIGVLMPNWGLYGENQRWSILENLVFIGFPEVS